MVRKAATVVAFVGAIAAGSALSAHAATRASVIGGVQVDSVTGCLQKGNSKDTYSVTDAAGNKHWVMSKTVPLDKHVGHTVTLTGSSMMSMSNSKMGSDSMKMSNKMGDKSMDVTALTMVSPSCK
jgi:hypothetical protein